MRFLIAARAVVSEFGRDLEKEDLSPKECGFHENMLSFIVKKDEFLLKLITASQVFSASSIRPGTEHDADRCEALEGRFIDKWKELSIRKSECDSIDCPCVKDADVYECDVMKMEEQKDSVLITGTILKHSPR